MVAISSPWPIAPCLTSVLLITELEKFIERILSASLSGDGGSDGDEGNDDDDGVGDGIGEGTADIITSLVIYSVCSLRVVE